MKIQINSSEKTNSALQTICDYINQVNDDNIRQPHITITRDGTLSCDNTGVPVGDDQISLGDRLDRNSFGSGAEPLTPDAVRTLLANYSPYEIEDNKFVTILAQ